MPTTLFAVDLDDGARALTRLLVTAEGRGATVRGVTTVEGGRTVLLWLTHRGEAAADHLLAALRRPTTVVAATAVPLVEAPRFPAGRVPPDADVRCWATAHPLTGRPVAVARSGPATVGAVGGTPESAALAALLAVAPPAAPDQRRILSA